MRLITHGHYLIKKRLVTLSDKRKNKYGSFNICQGVMSIKIFKPISRSKFFQFEYFFPDLSSGHLRVSGAVHKSHRLFSSGRAGYFHGFGLRKYLVEGSDKKSASKIFHQN